MGGKEGCLTIPPTLPFFSWTMIACLSLNYLYFHFEVARRGKEEKEGHMQPFLLTSVAPSIPGSSEGVGLHFPLPPLSGSAGS